MAGAAAASRGPSRSQSRGRDEEDDAGDDDDGDEEVARAIKAAEEDEDYSLLTALVLGGQGDKLKGRKSKNDEVNEFLQQIPGQMVRCLLCLLMLMLMREGYTIFFILGCSL